MTTKTKTKTPDTKPTAPTPDAAAADTNDLRNARREALRATLAQNLRNLAPVIAEDDYTDDEYTVGALGAAFSTAKVRAKLNSGGK